MSKCEQCIVRQFSAVKALSKEQLVRMASCKTSYTVKKGEAVFEEGRITNGVFCVKSGVCKLSKLSANGKDQILKFATAGELLGQRSLITDEPANLTATALDDMEVCFIPKSEIIGFFNESNQFSLEVMRSICGDLKEADEHKVSLAQKTVKQRIAEVLLYLYDNFGVLSDGSLRIQLSREELGGMVGTATESCIRLLAELQKEGYVKLDRKHITLLEINKLRHLAEHY
ncbi:Crp/Fnr family transcriptional regulator [Flavobacterium sp.]|uniref:Crp/Fnr family transcriptional regulator n=1 Tax=Flavobacterium sp. TaxID=239 RepID=UPI0026081950|nr:Crp/Fnr family transcriptional regulator [Flavobacterium sp.]